MNDTTSKNIPDVLVAISLIVLGAILLLNNFGILPWNIWIYIVRFWPTIFILIGLDMISGDSYFLKLTVSAIGIVIVAFVIVYSLYSVNLEFKNYINQKFPRWKNVYNLIPPINRSYSSDYDFFNPPKGIRKTY